MSESTNSPATPRDRSEELLDGAVEMLAEHGYHGSSLRDISKHIGISHPGLLHHFESKDALLDAALDRLEAHAETALGRTRELSAGRDALLRGLSDLWHPTALSTQLLATLCAEAVSEDYHGRVRISRLRKVHEHIFEECFRHFAGEGLLRDSADPAFAGRTLLGLVLSLAAREKTVRALQRRHHDDAPLEELARQVDVFLVDESDAPESGEERESLPPR